MTELVELTTTGIAHGGEAVGRHDGQVVFVRGALPGERVRVSITDAPGHGRFKRGVVTDVLDASPERVTAPCEYAGRCGGCDWQFVSLPGQRELKARVIREQLQRLGGEPADRWSDLVVQQVAGDDSGLHWRTRMRYAVDAAGRAGLHPYHSRDVLPVHQCLLAAPGINDLDVLQSEWADTSEVLAIAPAGPPVALADPRPGEAKVTESAAGRTWSMDATVFWQVHPGAADTLARAVVESARPKPGEHVIDLYAGVGLFAAAVLGDLGAGGRVDAVESNALAVKSARRTFHDDVNVHLHEGSVERWLRQTPLRRCDIVIADPPRSGAGKDVLERIFRLRPRAFVYVACDPAALARDVRLAREAGWHLTGLQAFDIFPMTHHVESVALFEPTGTVAS